VLVTRAEKSQTKKEYYLLDHSLLDLYELIRYAIKIYEHIEIWSDDYVSFLPFRGDNGARENEKEKERKNVYLCKKCFRRYLIR